MRTWRIYLDNKFLFTISSSSSWHAVELAMTETQWQHDRKKISARLAYV